jgi:hypothetical protein
MVVPAGRSPLKNSSHGSIPWPGVRYELSQPEYNRKSSPTRAVLESRSFDYMLERLKLDLFADNPLLSQARPHQIINPGRNLFFGPKEARQNRDRLGAQIAKVNEAFECRSDKLFHQHGIRG